MVSLLPGTTKKFLSIGTHALDLTVCCREKLLHSVALKLNLDCAALQNGNQPLIFKLARLREDPLFKRRTK